MYSQNAEEQYILQACEGVEHRRFLDIGSYHPTELSNTRALYEAGWHGIMIEPSPYAMQSLIEAYGNDSDITLIQASIGCEAALRPMHMGTAAVSTDSEQMYKLWKESGHYKGQVWIQHMLLHDLFMQFGAGFGFINIDAEGHSAEILLHLLALTKDTPCICAEWDGDPRGVMTAMTAADYVLVYSSAENGVWRKMAWEESHK